jgi:hypothetical protein
LCRLVDNCLDSIAKCLFAVGLAPDEGLCFAGLVDPAVAFLKIPEMGLAPFDPLAGAVREVTRIIALHERGADSSYQISPAVTLLAGVQITDSEPQVTS